jgi:hypothetical protein
MFCDGAEHSAPHSNAISAVPPFSGDDSNQSAHDWLRNMSGIADLYHWTDDMRLKVARIKCCGTAALWLDSVSDLVPTWAHFCSEFQDRFGEDLEALITRFEQCVQRRGETTRAYRDRFRSLAARAGQTDDHLLMLRFFKGLTRTIRRQLAPCKPNLHSFESVVRAAQSIELWGTVSGMDESGQAHDRPASPQL